MNAKEMLKQAVRQVCEEAGEPWEELYEEDFDDTTVSKTAEVFATLVLAEHAAELDALRTENARLRAELEAVGAGGVQPLRAEAGWVLVPVEPTDEMLEAAVQAICYGPGGGFTRISGPHRCWSAMLAAAHKAPKQAVLAEPAAWESITPFYIKHITQSRYEKFSEAVRRWYKPYRCSRCESAPQQAAPVQAGGEA